MTVGSSISYVLPDVIEPDSEGYFINVYNREKDPLPLFVTFQDK